MRSLFVSFEGPEGSGKSSQTRRLASALRRRGVDVVLVRDPGSTELGRRLRRVLLHTDVTQITPLAEALLFIAARIQLVEEQIRPALRRGAVVVCDRFHDSTMAYQAIAGRVDLRWLDQLGRRAIGGTMPSVTILLDLPAAAGLARRHGRRDRMESKGRMFHEQVRRGYLKLAAREPRRIVRIDASRPERAVAAEVLDVVLNRIKQKSRKREVGSWK